jgi:zinc/manganese transport system substrate-binding protein
MRHLASSSVAIVGLALASALGGFASVASASTSVTAVGAENEYASVISQIGGKYVSVAAIMSNPNSDPHTFEASPSVAEVVSKAGLVVQNGVGYDSFMNKIEAAAPNIARRVIDVQNLFGLPDTTSNPHLWYNPTTMPRVATAIAADLSKLEPSHSSYFNSNVTRFDDSLKPWLAELALIKAKFPAARVATTEPVADYMLRAAGLDNLTPFTFQADIMNGVDPSPQGVAFEEGLFSGHKVKVFVYNQQVTDTLTQSFINAAKAAGVPIVGVYETMPTPGYTYQTWMLAEAKAVYAALSKRVSTVRL